MCDNSRNVRKEDTRGPALSSCLRIAISSRSQSTASQPPYSLSLTRTLKPGTTAVLSRPQIAVAIIGFAPVLSACRAGMLSNANDLARGSVHLWQCLVSTIPRNLKRLEELPTSNEQIKRYSFSCWDTGRSWLLLPTCIFLLEHSQL